MLAWLDDYKWGGLKSHQTSGGIYRIWLEVTNGIHKPSHKNVDGVFIFGLFF